MSSTFVVQATPFYMVSVWNSWNRFELHGVQSREMKLKSGIRGRRVLLLSTLLGIGLATAGFVRYLTNSRSLLDTHCRYLGHPYPLSRAASRVLILWLVGDARNESLYYMGLIGRLTPPWI